MALYRVSVVTLQVIMESFDPPPYEGIPTAPQPGYDPGYPPPQQPYYDPAYQPDHGYPPPQHHPYYDNPGQAPYHDDPRYPPPQGNPGYQSGHQGYPPPSFPKANHPPPGPGIHHHHRHPRSVQHRQPQQAARYPKRAAHHPRHHQPRAPASELTSIQLYVHVTCIQF